MFILNCIYMKAAFYMAMLLAYYPVAAQILHPSQSEGAHYKKIKNVSKTGTYASDNFTVHFYRCDWTVSPTVRHISGNVTAHIIATKPASTIIFDLRSELKVDSIKKGATHLAFNHSPYHQLIITLPTPLSAGAMDSLTIYYEGVPPNVGFGSFIKEEHAGVPVIWTLSEPYGARSWWPCRDGLDDKADSIDITITTQIPFVVSSNGKLVLEEEFNATRRYHFQHRYPIASYLVAFAVTNYQMLSSTVNINGSQMPFVNYVYPENLAEWQTSAGQVLQSMEQCNQWFGPYPFYKEKYAQTQFSWGGGMEHQTNSFITGTDRYLMAHELVHQWFGDKITCATWQELWLNEGFAVYFGDLVFKNIDPTYYRSLLATQHANVVSVPGGSVWVDDTTNLNRLFSGRLTYDKGGYLLRMLNLTMGDSAFLLAIKNYVNDPKLAYGFATTKQLQQHLEAVHGKPLQYFFDQWFYGQGHPSFQINWRQDYSQEVTLQINQTTSHSSVPFFKMPVPVTLKKDGKVAKYVVFVDSQDQEVKLNPGFFADSLLVDEELEILSSNNVIKNQPIVPPATTRIFPNPVGSVLYIHFDAATTGHLVLRLTNTLGQQVMKKDLHLNTGGQLIELPLQYLARGIYHLTLFDANGNAVLKEKIMR